MKPDIVARIERIAGCELYTPAHHDPQAPLAGLMGYKKDRPRYAADAEGRLIGLNLAGLGLDDARWAQIEALLDGPEARLQALDLYKNQLTRFEPPGGVAEGLEALDIAGNPIEGLPEEALNKGLEYTRRYVRDIAMQGEEQLYEIKMLIVGEGGSGKTTLWNLIQNPDHPVPDERQKTTVGIHIRPAWPFPHTAQPDTACYVNLWDFGGQEIQYMTHQFFLTRRSLYVLLYDGRNESGNFAYWLRAIQLLGCDTDTTSEPAYRLPVVAVINDRGVANPKPPYNEQDVRQDYPQLELIKREVDFKIKDDGRLDALVRCIRQTICDPARMPHLPIRLPAYWKTIRKALETKRVNESKPYIEEKVFRTLCADNKVPEPEAQDRLSGLLHDLGAILHYRDDVRLRRFVILEPQWAANGVYALLDHKQVKDDNQGRFDEATFMRIMAEKGYDSEAQDILLNLMAREHFDVCFDATERGKKVYIAPQLLPQERPETLRWNPRPEHTIRYLYHYPFMPKGLIGRLIVRLNEHIVLEQGRKVVWAKGALLALEGCQALIRYIEDDREQGRKLIRIEVEGADPDKRKDALRDIRRELDSIHKASFPQLRFFQKIPCNCSRCLGSAEPHEHDYDTLLRFRQENGTGAVSQCGITGKPVPVRQLLEGVFGPEAWGGDRVSGEPPREVLDAIAANDLERALALLPYDGRAADIRRAYRDLVSREGKQLIRESDRTVEYAQITERIQNYYRSAPERLPVAGGAPPIHIHIENKPVFENRPVFASAAATDIQGLERLIAQLQEEKVALLKSFVESLPEPEDEADKQTYGKQIRNWLNKNAEGITMDLAASVYYDGLKWLFGLG